MITDKKRAKRIDDLRTAAREHDVVFELLLEIRELRSRSDFSTDLVDDAVECSFFSEVDRDLEVDSRG